MSPDPIAHTDQAARPADPARGGRAGVPAGVPGDSAAPRSADGAANPPARRDGADPEVIVRRTRDGWRVEGAGTGASGRSPRGGADGDSRRGKADQGSRHDKADKGSRHGRTGGDGRDGPVAGDHGQATGDHGDTASDQGAAAAGQGHTASDRSEAAGGQGEAAGEVMPDLVSAMVLAELLAGDVPRPRKPAVTEAPHPNDGAAATGAVSSAARGESTGSGGTGTDGRDGAGRGAGGDDGSGSGPAADDGGAARGAENTRLRATIAQLEHALATRVRIEQAIGVLAERHRLTTRQAFDLLRKVARSGGNRVHDLAGEVVASTTNPLLLLPAELARPQHQPARGRPRQRLRGGRDAREG